MTPLTTAQQLLIALGVHPDLVLLAHHIGRSETNTKKGPGRRHVQGRPADTNQR